VGEQSSCSPHGRLKKYKTVYIPPSEKRKTRRREGVQFVKRMNEGKKRLVFVQTCGLALCKSPFFVEYLKKKNYLTVMQKFNMIPEVS